MTDESLMPTTASQEDNKAPVAPARRIMPPHLVMRDFLEEETVAGLLDYALAHQAEFAPTTVDARIVKPSARVSVSLRKLGQYRQALKTRLLELTPRIFAELRVTPFEPSEVEIELVAHGDGAFYKPHIDTQTAQDDNGGHFRALSGVYYFYKEPKAFTGGALRLFAIGPEPAPYIDIEPVRNSLLVFPSWAPHEVRPVSVSSNRFLDSRFAINCWIYQAKAAAADN